MYLEQEKKEFKYEACWNLVKDTAKWHDHEKAQKEKQRKSAAKRRADVNIEHTWGDDTQHEYVPDTPSTGVHTPTTPSIGANTPSTGGSAAHGLERPPGRKASKKSRSKNTGEGGDLFMEQFRHMQVEDRGYYEKMVAENAATLAELRRLEIERKLQMREKELEARLREQEDLRREREFRRMKEERKEAHRLQKEERHRKELEMKIMFTNLNDVDDEATRRWVLRERKKIEERIEREEAGQDDEEYSDD